jgi:hypothetical protein
MTSYPKDDNSNPFNQSDHRAATDFAAHCMNNRHSIAEEAICFAFLCL